jgi:hypothetical protein
MDQRLLLKRSSPVASGCKNFCMKECMVAVADATTLQRHNTENVFPEKKLRSLSPNFHIHVSVSDLYIPTISLPILLQENMWTGPRNI